MPLRVMTMCYILMSVNFTGMCLSKFSQWTLWQNLGCRHMALTVKSSPFWKLFEIFHLESLRLGWWAGLEAAVCSTDGEELPSHRLEATMGQITGLEKALPTFSQWKKRLTDLAVSSCFRRGQSRGCFCSQQGRPLRNSPPTSPRYCLL